MGALLYGLPAVSIEIPDRALAHLKMAIIQKLRRGESFTLAVEGDPERDGFGRQTLWLSQGIPLRFVFAEPVAPALNGAWVNALAVSANSTGGLQLVEEPPSPDGSDSRPPKVKSNARLNRAAHAVGS